MHHTNTPDATVQCCVSLQFNKYPLPTIAKSNSRNPRRDQIKSINKSLQSASGQWKIILLLLFIIKTKNCTALTMHVIIVYNIIQLIVVSECWKTTETTLLYNNMHMFSRRYVFKWITLNGAVSILRTTDRGDGIENQKWSIKTSSI